MSAPQFTFGTRDEFNRQPVAANIIKLLASELDISPIVIDGDWGTGKSEFCIKLINDFKKEYSNYDLIYIDSFKSDHADNPLATILGAILNLYDNKQKRHELISKAIPVLRWTVSTAAKASLSHVLRQDLDKIGTELIDSLDDSFDQAIDASVKALLRDHEKSEIRLNALQKTLGEVTKEKPIVIFIDELDRCRPDFSLQMLEVIKHIFNIENVQFVLVTNSAHLNASIQHRYGVTKEISNKYLDKFFKFSVVLPSIVNGKREGLSFATTSGVYFDQIMNNSSIMSQSMLDNDNVPRNFAKDLLSRNYISLRGVEKFVKYLEIYQVLTKDLRAGKTGKYYLLAVLGIFLKTFKPDLMTKISQGDTNANDFAEVLGVRNLPDHESGRRPWIDTVAVNLALQCEFNKDRFELTDYQHKYWLSLWRSIGNNINLDIYDEANDFETIIEVVERLKLGVVLMDN